MSSSVIMPLSSNSSSLFHSFNTSVSDAELPKKFTFPFFYQPHPLAVIACDELQTWLTNNPTVLQDFNLDGKMFGVLVVRNQNNELGYLVAYSGKTLADKTLTSTTLTNKRLTSEKKFFKFLSFR